MSSFCHSLFNLPDLYQARIQYIRTRCASAPVLVKVQELHEQLARSIRAWVLSLDCNTFFLLATQMLLVSSVIGFYLQNWEGLIVDGLPDGVASIGAWVPASRSTFIT
jgi:hypothetical protein